MYDVCMFVQRLHVIQVLSVLHSLLVTLFVPVQLKQIFFVIQVVLSFINTGNRIAIGRFMISFVRVIGFSQFTVPLSCLVDSLMFQMFWRSLLKDYLVHFSSLFQLFYKLSKVPIVLVTFYSYQIGYNSQKLPFISLSFPTVSSH